MKRGVSPLDIVLGPLAAAASGRWLIFAMTAIVHLAGLALLFASLQSEPLAMIQAAIGIILVFIAHLGAAWLMDLTKASRGFEDGLTGPQRLRAAAAIVLFTYALTLYRVVAAEPVSFIAQFPQPKDWDTAAAQMFDSAVDWMKRNWVAFFDAFTAGLRFVLNAIEGLFVLTPWPVVALVATLLALRLSGRRAMIFTAACLAYLGLFGFWQKSMETLALMATSVLICVVVGVPLGILAAKNRRLNTILEPILDVMQTLPTFVYLIPAVAFFSIGKPPGVISTVIFALPSAVRLTALGIQQVPSHVREAANAFGATPMQLLLKVELPLAIPSIRLGINQSIMMSLSMVVVAAMIGAGGLGLDVIRSLQHLKTGQGALAGIAIVLCAMALDRMVRGRETRTFHKKPE